MDHRAKAQDDENINQSIGIVGDAGDAEDLDLDVLDDEKEGETGVTSHIPQGSSNPRPTDPVSQGQSCSMKSMDCAG